MMSRGLFAAQVRAARAFLGWKQSELATAADVSLPQINRLERGEHEPRYSTAQRIVQVLRAEGIEFVESPDGGIAIQIAPGLVARVSSGSNSEP